MNETIRKPLTAASPEMSAEYRKRMKTRALSIFFPLVSAPFIILSLEAIFGIHALAIVIPGGLIGLAVLTTFWSKYWVIRLHLVRDEVLGCA